MTKLVMLPIDDLEPAGDNPRRDLGDLTELAASINAVGLLEPILATKNGGTKLLIVAGHRRHAAARKAGLNEVPVIVREFDDRARVEAMVIENLQRTDLAPLEEAAAYKTLVGLGVKQRDLAGRIGRSQSHVSKRLALLELPAPALEALDSGRITVDQARELAPLKDAPTIVKRLLDGPIRNLDWAVKHELAEIDRLNVTAELRQQLDARKIRVVDYPDYGQWQRSKHKPLSGNDYDGIGIDTRKHAKEPCHAACITDGRHGEKAKIVYVCTDPSRHTSKGQSTIKAASSEKAVDEKTKKADEARGRREANKARLEILRKILATRTQKTELLEHILQTYVRRYVAAARLVCELLDIEVPKGTSAETLVKRYAAKGGVPLFRAALAIALADREKVLREGSAWSTDAHYALLNTFGYAPSEYEAGIIAHAHRYDRQLGMDEFGDGPFDEIEARACRVCGCTEDNCSQCVEKTGAPCSWVEDDLCSACVEASSS